MTLSNTFDQIAANLTAWLLAFKGKMGYRPKGRTLTEHLMLLLPDSVAVYAPDPDSQEIGKEHFDLCLTLEDEHHVVYLRAKMSDRHDVADFFPDWHSVMRGHKLRHEADDTHQSLWTEKKIAENEGKKTVAGGYIIYTPSGVFYAPMGKVYDLYTSMLKENQDAGPNELSEGISKGIMKDCGSLSSILTDKTDIPKYQRWISEEHKKRWNKVSD
ncbi:hypothetical protein FRC09_003920 [Ceratobasidium sp. 395]|nr:hypothetical protein FRC09_003920 [Ceratobasidium sp. 395]